MTGLSERTQELSKNGLVLLNRLHCTRALHSFLCFTHCCAASTIIPLLPITPSIEPTHDLPRTLPPLTSTINTVLAIQYSSILTTCLNHLLLLLKKVSSARLRESDIYPISPKTPAPQYQPIDRKKRKGKRVEDNNRDRAA